MAKRAPRVRYVVGLVVVLGVLAAACGGGDDKAGSGSSNAGGSSGNAKPTTGGKVTYGLEAEDSGGWCIPEAQLDISGIQVARAVYDTLTVPDATGQYKPFLATAVTPNATFDEWTIALRPGITFHDGSALDATVVKNNIDAWRGNYAGRNPLLFRFVYDNIKDVTVVDPLTLKVTTKVPWASFPAFLFWSGRAAIIGQAQLDDKDTCDSKLIGTGPFVQKEWKVGEKFVATKNPKYWQKDKNGTQLPYLDEIEFRPIPDEQARVNALLAGEINALHTTNAENIANLRTERDNGNVALVESDKFPEVSYWMLNVSKEPFDNLNARLAVANAVDMDTYNKIMNLNLLQRASGPFGPGSVGYLKDTGFPTYDLKKAKDYVAKYTQETGKPLEFTLTTTSDPSSLKSAQLIQEQLKQAGAKVTIKSVEQATLIDTALGNDWNAVAWRNHPGGNPDEQYIWWKGGSPVNFNKFKDPQIDSLLDQGRAEPDKEKAAAIYESINKRFAEQAYNFWLNWIQWDVGTAPTVKGVYGPNLPDGSEPFPGLATGHPVTGLYVSK
jgi:peptide/nickel transport system substrate-binding protein